MELSYLGIYEWVFEKVIQNIFTPVFDYVTSILNIAVGYTFEYIMGPIVLPILQAIFYWIIRVGNIIQSFLNYGISVIYLTVLDCMEKAFDIFVGLQPVVYYPYGRDGAVVIEKSLLEVLFSTSMIQNAFWVITFGGVGIALLLSIFGVAKSSFDLDFENKKPVSHVLKQLFKSVVGAFLIPFAVWFMLQLSMVILTSLNDAVSFGNQGRQSTLGSTLFTLGSVNAAWNAEDNMASWRMLTLDEGVGLEFKDVPNEDFDIFAAPRRNFYLNDTYDNYRNFLNVALYFDISRIDYVLVELVALCLIVIMVLCFLTIIRRIFEVLMLYLVSPYFVAMMPLDDGEKFKQWFGMFIGKLFTGYGTVVLMKIYLILMPVVLEGGVQVKGLGIESRIIMYILYMLGGAWAVYKSGSLLTGLVNEAAGRMEQESNREAFGTMMLLSSPIRQVASRIGNKVDQWATSELKSEGKKLGAEISAKLFSPARPKPPKPAKFKKAVINDSIKPRSDFSIGGQRAGAPGKGRGRARQLEPVSKAALNNKTPKVKQGKSSVKHIDYSKDKRPFTYSYFEKTGQAQGAAGQVQGPGGQSQGGGYTSRTDVLATPKEIRRVQSEAKNFSDPQGRGEYVGMWLQQRANVTGREMHLGYWDRTRLESTFNCDLSHMAQSTGSKGLVVRPKIEIHKADKSKGDKT